LPSHALEIARLRQRSAKTKTRIDRRGDEALQLSRADFGEPAIPEKQGPDTSAS
jgi:hypothetical protein